MSPLMLLQITALMCFIYALKIKMYKTNVIGFSTILAAFVSVCISFIDISSSDDIYFFINTFLLIFISFFHTYKSFKRKCNV